MSAETVRATLERMGVRWPRAKRWISSPDPEYARKKASRPVDPPGGEQPGLGGRFGGRDVVESLCPALDLRLEQRRQTPAPRATTGGQQRRPRPEGPLLLRALFAGVVQGDMA